jgi:hypothetical protein
LHAHADLVVYVHADLLRDLQGCRHRVRYWIFKRARVRSAANADFEAVAIHERGRAIALENLMLYLGDPGFDNGPREA